MTADKPERLGVQIEPVGFTLRWIDRKPGETLQGWYRTQDDYEAAAQLLAHMGLAKVDFTPWTDEAVTE